jgi:UDPglucose 6-dehydrogenase
LANRIEEGVVGAGYVRLVTGTCPAHIGHRVVCADKDKKRIKGLEGGRVPSYDPGFDGLASRGATRSQASASWSVVLLRM